MARDIENAQFLRALFDGEDFPVALSQSDAYPWRVDNRSVKTTSRQDDVNSNCWFALDVFVPTDSATVSFDYRVKYHKESYGYAKYANLTCSIDGEEVFRNNGNDKTETAIIQIPQGYHTLKWDLSLGEAWENWDYFASIENMKFEGISNESPLAEFCKQSVPFYNVPLNTPKRETLKVYNAGDKPLAIESITGLQKPFKVIDGENVVIPAGQSSDIVLEYMPEYHDYSEQTMTINTNVGQKSYVVNGLSSSGYVVVSTIPGGLSKVLNNTNCESIAIMGHLNRSDQYHLNKLKNCRYLNLAGTDIEVVTNGGLNNLWHLKTIVLPSSLRVLDTTWINQTTYEDNKWLKYFDLSCIQLLSKIPPKAYEFYGEGGNSEEKLFGNLKESTRILVPEECADAYLSSNAWSKMTIIPVVEETANLQVMLDTESPEIYSGTSLYLNNTDTYESSCITLQNDKEYSFTGLHPFYKYNVALKDKKSRLLGIIENIEPKLPQTDTLLSDIKGIHSAYCMITDNTGKDLTSDIIFEWFDENNDVLSNSSVVNSVLSGDSIVCFPILPESLARTYINPAPRSIRISESDTTLVYRLNQIQDIKLGAEITDAVNRKPIEGATVLITQYLNGRYQTTFKTTTDEYGNFTAPLKNDSTLISISVKDYELKELRFTNLDTISSFSEILVQPLSGVPITINYTYQAAVKNENEVEVVNYYDDHANVIFNIKNLSYDKDITKVEYNWPSLRLLENCSVGDSILIVARSKTDSFYPVESKCVIDSLGRGSALFHIIEYGGISSTYNHSDNQSTVGMLYGADKRLLASSQYYNSKLKIPGLKDGRYSLVTMGSNAYYNSIPSLLSLHEFQLKEGMDYLLTEFDVVKGKESICTLDSVPTFDADAHRFTGSSTSFNVNKTSVVAGSYVTIDTRIDFLPTIEEMVSNVSLIIELPSGVEFVKNSLLIGGNSSTKYSLKDNILTIPLNKMSDKIRFCLQPLEYGNYMTGGIIRFSIDDCEYIQPIGKASFSASSITLNTPSVTPFKEITVCGNTLANSEIFIYDYETLVGKATASGSGKWQALIELEKPYNLSHHQIYAKITTPDGIEMTSESKDVFYNKNEIAVSKVTMYHDNPEVGKTFSVEFDFLNPSPVTSSYTYYIYNKNFTFTIDLTDNDPEKVSDVVLWVLTGKGNEIALDAKYDEKQGLWVAAGQFGNMYDGDIPVNVGVSLSQEPTIEIDGDQVRDLISTYNSFQQACEKIDQNQTYAQNKIENEFNNSGLPDKTNITEILTNYLTELPETEEDSESVSYESVKTELDNLEKIVNQEFDIRKKYFDSLYTEELITYEDIEYVSYARKSDLSTHELEELGYERINTTDNSAIYIKETPYIYSIVLYDYGIEYGYEIPQGNGETKYAKAHPIKDFFFGYLNNWNPEDADQFVRSTLTRSCEELIDRSLKLLEPIATDKLEAASESLANRLIALAEKDIAPSLLKSELLRYLQVVNTMKKLIELLQKHGKSTWNAAKRITGNFGILQEYLAQRKALKNLPELYSCALEKYPEDIKQLNSDISEMHKILVASGVSRATQTAGEFRTFWKDLLLSGVKDGVNQRLSRTNWEAIDGIIKRISSLNSSCVEEERQRLISQGYWASNCPDAPNQIDPSGYVYETVPSNRLEGVKATCYHKIESENMYGDIIEKAVVWDATNYEQQNPLYTDSNGLYRWDVPEGLWMVKFEKDGYEPTSTDWLPVPPPQLDINVPMVQYTKPSISTVEWNENGIFIQFDKYMLPATVNTQNIQVTFNGEDIIKDISLENEESLSDTTDISYASVVKANLLRELDENSVIDVVVKGNVRSYAGITMGSDKSYRLSRIPSITEFVVDDKVALQVGEHLSLPICVKSTDAAKGSKLSILNSSPIIASCDENIILDNKGEGIIYVDGMLQGMTTLTLSIDGYNLTKQVSVIVSEINENTVSKPYASPDGSSPISKGTAIHLFCDTEGATIYYTLDGTCPCDYSTRIKYDGTPIVIDMDTEIRMMACKPGYEDSDIAVLHYIIQDLSVDDITQTEEIDIYPKVTQDFVYLNLHGQVASTLGVYDLHGKLIQSKSNVPDGSRINLTGLPSNIYLVSLHTDKGWFTIKIVKK